MGFDMDRLDAEDFTLEDLEDERIRLFLLSDKDKRKERGWIPDDEHLDFVGGWDE